MEPDTPVSVDPRILNLRADPGPGRETGTYETGIRYVRRDRKQEPQNQGTKESRESMNQEPQYPMNPRGGHPPREISTTRQQHSAFRKRRDTGKPQVYPKTRVPGSQESKSGYRVDVPGVSERWIQWHSSEKYNRAKVR
jgi:hypothetical protein